MIATQAGFSAVGLPGANNWKPFYGRVLADWSKILLFCDGDNAGREMAKSLSRELDNVFPVFMPEGCDVNDVFLTEGADGLRKRAGV
jgi:DNA primase